MQEEKAGLGSSELIDSWEPWEDLEQGGESHPTKSSLGSNSGHVCSPGWASGFLFPFSRVPSEVGRGERSSLQGGNPLAHMQEGVGAAGNGPG